MSGYILKEQEIILYFFISLIVVIPLLCLLNIYKVIEERNEWVKKMYSYQITCIKLKQGHSKKYFRLCNSCNLSQLFNASILEQNQMKILYKQVSGYVVYLKLIQNSIDCKL